MKVRITVQEEIKYTDTIIIEQPDDMTDQQFEDIIDAAERECKEDTPKDFAYALEKRGLKILEHASSFPDSPDHSELEVYDLTDIKE